MLTKEVPCVDQEIEQTKAMSKLHLPAKGGEEMAALRTEYKYETYDTCASMRSRPVAIQPQCQTGLAGKYCDARAV